MKTKEVHEFEPEKIESTTPLLPFPSSPLWTSAQTRKADLIQRGGAKLVIVREFVYTFEWVGKSKMAAKKEELRWRRINRQKV